MKNDVLKYGLILFIITAVSSGAVSAIYNITDPIIKQQNIEKDNAARQEIMPAAKTFEKIEEDFGDPKIEVYKALDGDKVVGYTIKTAPKGYGDAIEVMTGITAEKVISGVSIGNMAETPGLGARAKEEAFYKQYFDKEAKEIKVIKNGSPKEDEIVAIAGATITSSAVTSGVNQSIKIFDETLNN